ncbi:hypothetical protein MMAN_16330 [Mycobacterium mantenii]|uniref:Uncharacterized protein n=1 Tax=Mycobacterium mantenii TaxID=560555 RepID=A0ABN6A2V6_MYCNT|nr:hypothetical protein MMAN_16330 [Mycobacterium mantenii]
MLNYNHIHRQLGMHRVPNRPSLTSRAPRGDHMVFEVIDPVAIMFLLLAGLGLIMAVAYGRM